MKLTICDRVSAFFGRSLTMAWAFLLVAIGFALDLLDPLSTIMNTSEAQAIVTIYGGKWAAFWPKLAGILTAAARARGILALWWKQRNTP